MILFLFSLIVFIISKILLYRNVFFAICTKQITIFLSFSFLLLKIILFYSSTCRSKISHLFSKKNSGSLGFRYFLTNHSWYKLYHWTSATTWSSASRQSRFRLFWQAHTLHTPYRIKSYPVISILENASNCSCSGFSGQISTTRPHCVQIICS